MKTIIARWRTLPSLPYPTEGRVVKCHLLMGVKHVPIISFSHLAVELSVSSSGKKYLKKKVVRRDYNAVTDNTG